MNREGPQNLGTVVWPQPKAGVLKGVKILSTGVFETIERDDLVNLLEGCGAHYYSGMSPHLHYLLVGRDAGPVKLQVAEEKGIPQLTEEQFYEWIKEKIENYVPTAEDLEDTKKIKVKKGKAAARPKPEPKTRKAPAKRQPLSETIEYDSDDSESDDDDYDSENSSGSEDVSDDEDSPEEEDEPVTAVKKKTVVKKEPEPKAHASRTGVKKEANAGNAKRGKMANGVKKEPADDGAVSESVPVIEAAVAVKQEKVQRAGASKRGKSATGPVITVEPKAEKQEKAAKGKPGSRGKQKQAVVEAVVSKRPRRACKQ